jgi:hypothetical protein
VGDVVNGTPAESEGFEPGLLVEAGSLAGDLDEVYYMGLVLPLNATQLLEVERTAQFTVPGIDSRAQLDAYIKEHAVSVEVDIEVRPPRAPFETRKLDGGVTYVRFDNFDDAAIIDQVLAASDAANRAGLIVDLRHNGGGRIDLMARVLGRLLGPDVYVGTARSESESQFA